MKKIVIIPTLLTLGNGVCGFAAILCASRIGTSDSLGTDPFFALSGWFIVAAMLFDSLDGYVARLSRTASKFGGELDSLCDAISFGVAPAFLLLRLGPGWEPRPILHQLLTAIAILYMVCAVLRLARFNVENTPDPASHKRFRGLPSPGAAGCIASLAILRGELPSKLALYWAEVDAESLRLSVQRLVEIWAPLGALVVALLMVSRIPYPHATKQLLRGRKHFSHLVQVILAGFLIILFREMALAALFWGYALAMPVRYVLLRKLRKGSLPAPSLDDVVRPH
ncbi:MAG: CDP-diacylglycerol--serine O-phosphatidyltransferase [Gemmataceae bacterium]|nr:CDP-diacylglycerol--serine O-phosphatidyltransferase [Gemmataceae bacterium]